MPSPGFAALQHEEEDRQEVEEGARQDQQGEELMERPVRGEVGALHDVKDRAHGVADAPAASSSRQGMPTAEKSFQTKSSAQPMAR